MRAGSIPAAPCCPSSLHPVCLEMWILRLAHLAHPHGLQPLAGCAR